MESNRVLVGALGYRFRGDGLLGRSPSRGVTTRDRDLDLQGERMGQHRSQPGAPIVEPDRARTRHHRLAGDVGGRTRGGQRLVKPVVLEGGARPTQRGLRFNHVDHARRRQHQLIDAGPAPDGRRRAGSVRQEVPEPGHHRRQIPRPCPGQPLGPDQVGELITRHRGRRKRKPSQHETPLSRRHLHLPGAVDCRHPAPARQRDPERLGGHPP